MSGAPYMPQKKCGARCRTKGGAPCLGWAMKNGRCRMHGGVLSKREIHGRQTLRARTRRSRDWKTFKELKEFRESFRKAMLDAVKGDNQFLSEFLENNTGRKLMGIGETSRHYEIAKETLMKGYLSCNTDLKGAIFG